MYKYTIFQPDPFPTKVAHPTKPMYSGRVVPGSIPEKSRDREDKKNVYKYTILMSAHAIPQGGELDKPMYCGLGTQEFETPRYNFFFSGSKPFFLRFELFLYTSHTK